MATRKLHAPARAGGALCNHRIRGPFASSPARVTCSSCRSWPSAVAAAYEGERPADEDDGPIPFRVVGLCELAPVGVVACSAAELDAAARRAGAARRDLLIDSDPARVPFVEVDRDLSARCSLCGCRGVFMSLEKNGWRCLDCGGKRRLLLESARLLVDDVLAVDDARSAEIGG